MAHFLCDQKPDGTYYTKVPSMFENFVYDTFGQEDKCVWKDRDQLESYFLYMALIFCWTVIVPVIKIKLWIDSKGKKDHRTTNSSCLV
jgi:hypothetical protein